MPTDRGRESPPATEGTSGHDGHGFRRCIIHDVRHLTTRPSAVRSKTKSANHTSFGTCGRTKGCRFGHRNLLPPSASDLQPSFRIQPLDAFVVDPMTRLPQLRGTWIGTRTDDSREPACATNLKAKSNQVKDALEQTGRAVLYGIYFDHDSDVLKPESEPTLNNVLDWLRENPETSMEFGGHTDADGSDEYNVSLSERRAQSVVAWMSKNDIAAERLAAVGYGESRPVANNTSPRARPLIGG